MASGRSEPLHGLRILVVEDHLDTAEMYQAILEADGASVATAGTPSQAIVHCHTVVPDVIVTDLTFGGLKRDGAWLLEQVRSNPLLAHVRVVAVTGRALDASWKQQYAFDAVLTKPVEPSRLRTLLADLTSTRRRRRHPDSSR